MSKDKKSGLLKMAGYDGRSVVKTVQYRLALTDDIGIRLKTGG
jgi:hypothetical protein